MANPIQQGLKHYVDALRRQVWRTAAMANPIQQGLKLHEPNPVPTRRCLPQWLIQYNKD